MPRTGVRMITHAELLLVGTTEIRNAHANPHRLTKRVIHIRTPLSSPAPNRHPRTPEGYPV